MLAYWYRHARTSLRIATTPGVFAGDRLRALEALARIHNGGPRGAAKPATAPYWAKVKTELQQKH